MALDVTCNFFPEGKPATRYLGGSYCKRSKPCALGQGDCDNDSECGKDLKCGDNNCRDFDPKAPIWADCCIKNEGIMVKIMNIII